MNRLCIQSTFSTACQRGGFSGPRWLLEEGIVQLPARFERGDRQFLEGPPFADLAEELLAGRFGFYRPPGGFYLWLDVGDGEAAALRLWREAGVRVLPGAYMAQEGAPGSHEANPGHAYVRIALVDTLEAIETALERLVKVL